MAAKNKKDSKMLKLWKEFAEVDENGVSRVVLTSEIKEQFLENTKYATLYWSKEGPTRADTRGGPPRFRGIIEYEWDLKKNKGFQGYYSMQSIGINQTYVRSELKKNRPIRKDIREYHMKNFKHCCLCCETMPKKKSKWVIDHKDDTYSDSNVCGKDSESTQKKEDFQLVCEACNRLKDLMQQTYPDWRPPAGHYLQIGWGDYFIDNKCTKREYWYDGEAYRKYWKNGRKIDWSGLSDE